VSYGIVTRMGGTIECHSREGAGTEFIVRLPALGEGEVSPRAPVTGSRRLVEERMDRLLAGRPARV
jgi:hypothetical protein